jgi:Zn ribbon nucleic-acid-binding protein
MTQGKPKKRQCQICQTTLVQRTEEQAQGFARRTTCSEACRNRLRSITQTQNDKPLGLGRCLICDEPLERGTYSDGRLEPLNKFEKGRKTCSAKCCNQLRSLTHKKRSLKVVEERGARTCVACGHPMERREKETPSTFSARKTCSTKCRIAYTAEKQKRNASKPKPQRPVKQDQPRPVKQDQPRLARETREADDLAKPCVSCGVLMKRREKEILSSFVKRKTCSPACTSNYFSKLRSKAVIVPDRRCLICQDLLIRKSYEMPNVFARRVTCGNACRLVLMQRRALLFDFYGVALPRDVIGTILGLSKTVIRHRFPASSAVLKQVRLCGRCKQPGHNIRGCPLPQESAVEQPQRKAGRAVIVIRDRVAP